MTPPLFVAVPVPPPVAAQLAAAQNGVPGARWVAPSAMHVTLRYLGALEAALAAEIAAALSHVQTAPFQLAIGGSGHFPGSRGSHALYARVTPSPPLQELRDKVEAAARRAGLAGSGRRWRPHVTLARVRHAPPGHIARFLETNGLLSAPPFQVERFALYQSHRSHYGASYVELERYLLTGGLTAPQADPAPRR